MARLLLLLSLLPGLALAAGCGGTEVASAPRIVRTAPPVPPHVGGRLTEREAFTVGVATTAVDRCTEPERPDLPRLRGFVSDLVDLAHRKPDVLGSAFGEPDTTTRAGLVEVAETLERDGCQLEQARRARAALAALPPAP